MDPARSGGPRSGGQCFRVTLTEVFEAERNWRGKSLSGANFMNLSNKLGSVFVYENIELLQSLEVRVRQLCTALNHCKRRNYTGVTLGNENSGTTLRDERKSAFAQNSEGERGSGISLIEHS